MQAENMFSSTPVVRLARQRDGFLPFLIISRLFRGENMLRVTRQRFLQDARLAIEMVRDERGEDFGQAPEEMLRGWSGGAGADQEPWFSLVKDEELGACVELRPAARALHDMVVQQGEEVMAITSEAMNGMFSSVIASAHRLRGDNAAQIMRLEAEIEERRNRIKDLQGEAMMEVAESEKRRYAEEMMATLAQALGAIRVVPEQMQKSHRRVLDVMHNPLETHGETVGKVLDLLLDQTESPGYRVLTFLSDFASDENKRTVIEDAITVIVRECGDYLLSEARRDAINTLSSVAEVAKTVIARNKQSSEVLAAFIKSDEAEKRGEEMRALSALAASLKKHAPHARIGSRMLTGTNNAGLMLLREREMPARYFDFRLTDELREPEPQAVVEPARSHEEDFQAAQAARREYKRARALSADNIVNRIRSVISKHRQAVPLSAVMEEYPLEYGSSEMAQYVQAALERVPASVETGWALEVKTKSEGRLMSFVVPDIIFLSFENEDPRDAAAMAGKIRPSGPITDKRGNVIMTSHNSLILRGA